MSPRITALTGLRARIVVASMVCASLATLVMVRVVFVQQTRTLFEQAEASPVLARAIDQACSDARAVELGPAHLANGRVRVFDDSGRARDGGATPAVVAAIVGGERRSESLSFWGYGGSAFAVRRAERGDCAIASLEIVPSSARRRAGGLMLALVFAAVLASVALTTFIAVRPLSNRLGALAKAAGDVGEGSFAPPPDPHSDDVAALRTALVESHARIVRARETAAMSRAALEEHVRGVAHDLRTPITALGLALERAQRETDVDARARAIADALRDATYLGALVENLETETRVKGRALAEVQVDLCELVGGAIARAQAVGAQYGAEVDGAVPDEPVVRTTDPIALGRALSNLTENAVRHGARHVAVTLRVDAGAFCIEVRDDSGADPASFRRGRGLGIASTICEALALELRMVSESGELVASIRETPEGSSHGNET